MLKKIFCTASVIFVLVSAAAAQETLKTLTLSNVFTNIAGTPRVTRNGFKHLWLVAWRQNPTKIMGRLVQSDGSLGPVKTMVSGVTNFEQNFDISYDAINYTYLLAFETAQGLQTQFFDANFVKKGSPSLIEGGVTNSGPRLSYDGNGKKFLIFWLGTQDGVSGRVLKSRVLDPSGKPSADTKVLSTAGAGKVWAPGSLSTNQKNGNRMLMLLEKSAASGSLIGFNAKADGVLLRPAPSRFQPDTAGLSTFGDASFLDAGTGFGIWSDKTSIKYRKINAAGNFASGTKSINNVADANSLVTSLLLDSRNNLFVGVWTQGNAVRAAALATATGAITKQPFQVATSTLTQTRNAATSYDPQEGNVLVVWEDSNQPASTVGGASVQFKIRGAIFFVAQQSSNSNVSIGDNFYSPAQLTVSPGTTVKWTNNGNSPHTVTSTSGGILGSSTLNRGNSFEFRFTSSGTFNYFCTIHGQVMSGTITVTADQEPPPRY
jgi:plastocyanin